LLSPLAWKVCSGDRYVDIIFSSGNGICTVDDDWFNHAVGDELFKIPVRLCPLEEMIWCKAFVMERERYDGADVAHILRACGERMDWRRLLQRFDVHWRILLAYLILFGYIYPSDHSSIPEWVMQELLTRLQTEKGYPPSRNRVCRGTLLSRIQYRDDIERWDMGRATVACGSDDAAGGRLSGPLRRISNRRSRRA